MDDDKEHDEATKSQTTDAAAEPKKADDTTEPKGEEKKSEAKAPTQRESALKAVADRRAEMAATSATERKQGDADAKGKGSETDDESADDKSSKAQAGDESKSKEKQETRTFTAEQIAQPGFFDSLDKPGWAALEKQHPGTAAMYKAARADLTRLGQKLAEKAATLEEKTKAASSAAKKESDELSDDEKKELEALGFTAADVEKLFKSKVGRGIIASIAEDVVKSMGVDPERHEAQVNGFELALAKCPELKDDEVWEAVQREINADPEESKALDNATDPKEISRILRAAAGRVTTDRAKTTKSSDAKDEKKKATETKNATQPVSRAIGKPRSSSSLPVDEKAPIREQMKQFIANRKAEAGYKELH